MEPSTPTLTELIDATKTVLMQHLHDDGGSDARNYATTLGILIDKRAIEDKAELDRLRYELQSSMVADAKALAAAKPTT